MESCIERPRNFCSLHGALDVVGNIWRAIPILHASPGCSMQASQRTNLYYLGGYHGLPSSNAYEKEVVFGGVKRLEETVRGSLEVMEGDVYAVLTGCSMGINGDNVEAALEPFADSELPIVSVDTAGFRGDTYTGYQMAMLALLKGVAKKERTIPNLVNLYGQPPSTDTTFRGDLEEITRLLARIGVKVNTFFIRRDGVAQLKDAGNAALNVNISPWLGKNIDALLKANFGIETLTLSGWPVGPEDTAAFLREVARRLNAREPGTVGGALLAQVVAEEEQYVYEYLDSLMGTFERHRFVLVGESAKALGLARFLVNVHGHIPLALVFTDTVPQALRAPIADEVRRLECGRKADAYFETDSYEIARIARKYGDGDATLLIGSSYEKPVADEIGAFFVSATNPNLSEKILNKAHVGTRGCITFIEDMYNHY